MKPGKLSKILLILTIIVSLSKSKNQYVQPLNMGMQVAMPYDIANIFNRPIHFGPISALLSMGCLMYLLFFGVITSPFGYFFGVPSEKYVMGDSWKTLPADTIKTARIGVGGDIPLQHHWGPKYSSSYGTNQHYGYSRSLSGVQENATKIVPPDFETQIFSGKLGEEVKDIECRKLVICRAHSGLRNLPYSLIKWYQFFSKRLWSISSPYRKAILHGIEGGESCDSFYDTCNDNIFGILIRGLVKLMPTWSRKKTRSYPSF